MKKILCFIMSMIIVLSFSISTNAVDFDDTEMLTMTGSYSEDDLFCDNFYYHILNDGTAEISEYVGEESTLTIPEQMNGIPVTSFKISGDNLTVLNIPSSFVSYDKYDQYMYWLGWHNLKEINVDPDNAVYSSVDGVMYNKDKTVLIQVPMAREGSSYTVPEGVSDIGYNAFYNSKISEIWLPNSLNLLSDNVFTSCQNLVDIFVGEDNPCLYSLDGVLYRGKGKTAHAIIAYPCGRQDTEYKVSEGTVYIGGGAFKNAQSLEYIETPDSLCYIEVNAFMNCKRLQSIYLSKNFWGTLGNSARLDGFIFDGCERLADITVDPENTSFSSENGVWFNKNKTLLIKYPQSKSDPQYVMPDSVTEIYNDAFRENKYLQQIVLSDNCKILKEHAFDGCVDLKECRFNQSLTEIEYAAFKGCSSLQEVSLPDCVYRLEASSFYECTNLKSANIPAGVEVAEKIYEYCENLTDVTIAEGVKELHWTFAGCKSLQTVELPDSLEVIGEGTFNGCKLTEISLPVNVRVIGEIAFGSNDRLKKVIIPDSVKQIESGAFGYCTELEDVIIGNGVLSLGDYAFSQCKNLNYVYIGNHIENIGNHVFLDCNNLTKVTMNSGYEFLKYEVFDDALNRIKEIKVDKNNPKAFDINGILFSNETNEMLFYPRENETESLEIPEGITTILDIRSHYLEELNVPSSVTSIGEITNNVNLESINVAEGNPVYYSIDGILFSKATNEMLIYPKGNTTQTLTIPEGVEKLCGIDSTELKTLNLSSTVIDFGDLNCDNLETINVNQNSNTYCSIDGVLYNKALTEMLYYPWGNVMTDYHIPATVVTLKGELGGTWYSGNNRFGHGTKYLKNIYVPKSVTDFGRYPFTLCGDCIENIIVDKSNPVYHSKNGIMYKGSSVAAYPQNNKTKDFHIPEGTNGVTGNSYLNGCRYVENVYMPASLTKFNFGLFEFCESLKNIYVDENNPDFCDIDGILYNKQKTRLICYPRGKENDVVVLPDGTEELEYCSFYKCNQITGLVIPQSMKNLNGYAFIQCENLREFTFNKDIQSISGIGYVLGGGPGAGGWKIGDIENVTIRGYSSTVAESYARDNGFTFISLGKVDRLLGDTDGDDSITIVDATVIQRHLAEIPTAVYIEAAADADQDGQVTILDATAIQRWLAELPVYEGIGKIFV